MTEPAATRATAKALTMPALNKVEAVGADHALELGFSDGTSVTFYDSSNRPLQVTPERVDLRLSLEVEQCNGSPVLALRLTNLGKRRCAMMDFDYLHPESKFVIWLVRKGEPVPLSGYGKNVQQRMEFDGVWAGGGPNTWLGPGESRVFKVYLKKLFQIESPGNYTVVAEDGPVWSNNEPNRAEHAARTSFVLSAND